MDAVHMAPRAANPVTRVRPSMNGSCVHPHKVTQNVLEKCAHISPSDSASETFGCGEEQNKIENQEGNAIALPFRRRHRWSVVVRDMVAHDDGPMRCAVVHLNVSSAPKEKNHADRVVGAGEENPRGHQARAHSSEAHSAPCLRCVLSRRETLMPCRCH